MDHGMSVVQLHQEYQVGQTTVYDIKAQKDKLLEFYADSDSDKDIAK